jgi:hypothetical protein
MLMTLGEKYGKLPHEFLYTTISDFNFDIAVTVIGNKKLQEQQGNTKAEPELNKFSDDGEGNSFSQAQFEKIFKVT